MIIHLSLRQYIQSLEADMRFSTELFQPNTSRTLEENAVPEEQMSSAVDSHNLSLQNLLPRIVSQLDSLNLGDEGGFIAYIDRDRETNNLILRFMHCQPIKGEIDWRRYKSVISDSILQYEKIQQLAMQSYKITLQKIRETRNFMMACEQRWKESSSLRQMESFFKGVIENEGDAAFKSRTFSEDTNTTQEENGGSFEKFLKQFEKQGPQFSPSCLFEVD